MVLGVRERNKRAKSFCVYCHDTRIMTFRTALGLRGKGAFVYSFRSLTSLVLRCPATVSSGAHLCARSIGSRTVQVQKDHRDNVIQLPYFADEKVQPQMNKGASHGLEQSLQIENSNYKDGVPFALLIHFVNVC